MAEGKNSFILYKDLIHTVRKLPKEKVADLFVTILEYVNDLDPKIDDPIIDLVFEPIRQGLKRDLQKWNNKKSKLSEAGRLGGINSGISRHSKQMKQMLSDEANEAVSVSVTDSVSVSVSEGEKAPPASDANLSVFNAEDEILKNKIQFERICIACRAGPQDAKKSLRKYHLYLEEKNQYPKSKKSVFAGFEKWLLNEPVFTPKKQDDPPPSGPKIRTI